MDTKKGAGVHAEEEALLKLKTNTKRVKTQINVVVIRVSMTNRLQPSKPCESCIKKMRALSNKKGYKIREIWYSDKDNKLTKTTLEILEKEENKHITKYYRNVYG
jgi:hypothetical protein